MTQQKAEKELSHSMKSSTGSSTTGATRAGSTPTNTIASGDEQPSIILHAPFVGDVSLEKSWERRWQTLAMCTCSLYFILPSIAVAWAFTIWCLLFGYQTVGPWLTVATAGYLGYAFVLDESPTTRTRSPILRWLLRGWWERACDYLPLLLVKTADLPVSTNDGDEGQRYILGYHPHGIISVGCYSAFATDGARVLDLTTDTTEEKDNDDNGDEQQQERQRQRGFAALFPGLDRRVVTLPPNLKTPFLREYFLSLGVVTSAKESFRNVLSSKCQGNKDNNNVALVIVVGGAAESLSTAEGSMDLILQSRKGFCREAILARASLVPVLGFGENDLYHVARPGSYMARVQAAVKKWTGFGMPLFRGRSILFRDVGIMPKRKPVVVVVGAPLPPPKWNDDKEFCPEIDRKTGEALNKDGQTLNEYHAQYVAALEELYETYKDAPWNVPGRERRNSMKIVR
eukprot:scaffold3526_cov153-Amphora_coffeaeformis.AAC.3